jgi:hypothetical protein
MMTVQQADKTIKEVAVGDLTAVIDKRARLADAGIFHKDPSYEPSHIGLDPEAIIDDCRARIGSRVNSVGAIEKTVEGTGRDVQLAELRLRWTDNDRLVDLTLSVTCRRVFLVGEVLGAEFDEESAPVEWSHRPHNKDDIDALAEINRLIEEFTSVANRTHPLFEDPRK